jgi:hypothetical protein
MENEWYTFQQSVVIEKIRQGIKFLDSVENTMYHNLWDTAKAVLRASL